MRAIRALNQAEIQPNQEIKSNPAEIKSNQMEIKPNPTKPAEIKSNQVEIKPNPAKIESKSNQNQIKAKSYKQIL